MNQKKYMRIMVIDDNPAAHQDIMKILMTDKSGRRDRNLVNILPEFEIDNALEGKEGFAKIKQGYEAGKPYALAFVDLSAATGWGGIETIQHIWEVDNHIQIVIVSDDSDAKWEETIEHLGHRDNLLILRKPFDQITIQQIANALTKKWELFQESKSHVIDFEQRVSQRTESLEKSLSLMRAALETSADGVLIVNTEKKITEFNSKFHEMWLLPKSVTDAKDFKLFADYVVTNIENPEEFIARLKKLDRKPDETVAGTMRFKNGKIFEYYSQKYTTNEIMIGRVWSFKDITKRVSLEEELQFQATHDALSGLPNRVLLLDRIKQSMAKSDRKHNSFGIFFLDLDRFKLINDSLNHEAGDEILREVAARLLTVLRAEDTLARLGGDEFVLIVNDVNQVDDLMTIAKKILSVFERPFEIYGHVLMLTTSLGICIYPKDGRHIDVLLRNADTAMYRAKELGANQFQFYTDDLNKRNLERLAKESELRQAIANNEFFLNFQPQYDLLTGKFVSVEALIRWGHPVKGVILPMDFIPLSEESGLIVPIGEWVLRTACKQVKSWINSGLPPICMAVNITAKQFKLYNLALTIENILEETGLDPSYLELELTEDMLINNPDIIETVKEIKKMGVKIVLDDFGTGYSSLNSLRKLPIDRLKIDQSYVQNFDAERGDDVIIQAIIAMGKSLNLDVLAEGIETQKQLEFLKNVKCGEGQGYYFSKPMSAEELEELLKQAAQMGEDVT